MDPATEYAFNSLAAKDLKLLAQLATAIKELQDAMLVLEEAMADVERKDVRLARADAAFHKACVSVIAMLRCEGAVARLHRGIEKGRGQ